MTSLIHLRMSVARYCIQIPQHVQQWWHAGQKKRHLLCWTALWRRHRRSRLQASVKESNSCLPAIFMRDRNIWACVWHTCSKLPWGCYWYGYARGNSSVNGCLHCSQQICASTVIQPGMVLKCSVNSYKMFACVCVCVCIHFKICLQNQHFNTSLTTK